MALLVVFDGESPHLSESTWVAPNATLIGRVSIADKASVFYGAVLRADVDSITVGPESNLQDNVVVHCDSGKPTTVGARVSVGHGAILHGCMIEDDCLIGMGARVLSGAIIGAGSLVAAGAVVLEGSIVPPGSLVAGVPARVRRELRSEEQADIRRNASHYVQVSAAHRAAG